MIQLGQGPEKYKYLIIGSGRLAAHFIQYFKYLEISYSQWSRKENSNLNLDLGNYTHILLAISDSSLESMTTQILALMCKQELQINPSIVHFSGAANINGTVSAHPLMTFSNRLYAQATYEKIHFVVNGVQTIQEIFPKMKNTSSPLFQSEKPFYHTLCVMAGNFPQMIWSKVQSEFVRRGIPEEAFHHYLEQILHNFQTEGPQALTGPLIRNDQITIQKNLKSLHQDPWLKVYEAFLEVSKPQESQRSLEL